MLNLKWAINQTSAHGENDKEENVENAGLEQHSRVDPHVLGSPVEDEPEEKQVQEEADRGTEQGIPVVEEEEKGGHFLIL